MKAKLKLTIYFNAIDKLPKLWKYRYQFYPLKKVLLLTCNYLATDNDKYQWPLVPSFLGQGLELGLTVGTFI